MEHIEYTLELEEVERKLNDSYHHLLKIEKKKKLFYITEF